MIRIKAAHPARFRRRRDDASSPGRFPSAMPPVPQEARWTRPGRQAVDRKGCVSLRGLPGVGRFET
jgi:hypothetical protein